MSYHEKSAWSMAVVTVLIYVSYGSNIKGWLASGDIANIEYAGTMLWAIGTFMVLAIIIHIVLAILSYREDGKEDVRDQEIYRFGEYVGQYFLGFGALAALLMALAEWDHFWIANIIYFAFGVSTLIAYIIRIVAYRRGF